MPKPFHILLFYGQKERFILKFNKNKLEQLLTEISTKDYISLEGAKKEPKFYVMTKHISHIEIR